MSYPSIYLRSTTNELIERIQKLDAESQPQWGKMNVGQMLSHCCVPYQQILGEDTTTPNFFVRTILKIFLKKSMTNEVPYKQNLPTGPNYIRNTNHDFEEEKARLIDYIQQIEKMGPENLSKIPSKFLGKLTAQEWSNQLYKHLDHHLQQFGV